MDRVAEIRERLEKATPGEWRRYDHAGPWHIWRDAGEGESHIAGDVLTDGDADLIAHAPSDLSWALDVIEEARMTVRNLLTLIATDRSWSASAFAKDARNWLARFPESQED